MRNDHKVAVLVPTRQESAKAADDGPRALRVLILTSEAPPVVSGIARSVAILSDGLRARGHHVDVVSRADFPRMLRHEIRISGFGLFWPSFRRGLMSYDVVNLHGPVPTITEVFLSMMRTLPGHRKPGVVYTHHSDLAIPGLDRACRWYNRLIERLAHTADAIVVTSADYRDKLARHDGAPLHLIPWAVTSEARHYCKTASTPGRLRVLFVGQLRAYKGLRPLLTAVAGAPEIDLTIIGDGPMRAEVEARVAADGLSNVRVLGRVDDDTLWRHYADADAVVLPSTTTAEAYGLVLIEGMSAGCVPIASDLPGVRGVAAPTGIVVPAGDVVALRRALRDLAADPDRLHALAAASREHALSQGMDRMVDGYEQVLRYCAGRVTARQSRAVTPIAYADPHAFLRDVNQWPGSTRASLALVDLGSGRHARVWTPDNDDAVIREAPVATYVARRRQPRLITGRSGEPELQGMLQRDELSSSLLVPFRVGRSTVAVLGISTHHGSDLVLDEEHLAGTVQLLAGIRSR